MRFHQSVLNNQISDSTYIFQSSIRCFRSCLFTIFLPGAIDTDERDDQHQRKHGHGGRNGDDDGVLSGAPPFTPLSQVPPVFP